MENIYTVGELIEDLGNYPADQPVMMVVVKYPGEFTIKPDLDGNPRWDNGTDVEVHPLEHGEITEKDGQVWLTVELHEYNEERAMLNGAGAASE